MAERCRVSPAGRGSRERFLDTHFQMDLQDIWTGIWWTWSIQDKPGIRWDATNFVQINLMPINHQGNVYMLPYYYVVDK